MCGRYVSTKSTADLLDEFDAEDLTEAASADPDYNVAPTDPVRAVLTRLPRSHGGQSAAQPLQPVRQLRIARWGLVPSWAKDVSVGNRMFNARAESIGEKSAFKRAFAKRRCLLPADGWYEWMRDTDELGKPRKQPFFMTRTDGASLALAGLYEFWRPKDAAEDVPLLLSVTILTVQAMGELAEIHDRMPLVIGRPDWGRWLDPALDGPVDLTEARDEVAAEHLELRPVSAAVNSVQNNSADLIARVDPPTRALELF
jgi:putative SOS response-associated peptidase YedK